MLTATNMFAEAMEKWVKAVRADDFATAKRHAEAMVRSCELLVIHPDFRNCFAHHYPGVEPKDALLHMCQFLVCATDCRAHVLKLVGAGESADRSLNEPTS